MSICRCHLSSPSPLITLHLVLFSADYRGEFFRLLCDAELGTLIDKEHIDL